MQTEPAAMTYEVWSKLSTAERDAFRDNSALNPELVGLEGWHVEVTDCFGVRCYGTYTDIRKLYKAR
ncbi:MAG: hypothetical protein KGL63_06580 [Betaproteobacteria bacterium]|nr:hypothetical protein [Betaproteobacteria bacterium]